MVSVVLSIGLAAITIILAILLLFIAMRRKTKVYNNHVEDFYNDDYVLVEKSSIKSEDGSFFMSLWNELMKKEEYNTWVIVIPERVVDDEVTSDYMVKVTKSFAKRHNGQTLIVKIEGRDDENAITLYQEETYYKFSSN